MGAARVRLLLAIYYDIDDIIVDVRYEASRLDIPDRHTTSIIPVCWVLVSSLQWLLDLVPPQPGRIWQLGSSTVSVDKQQRLSFNLEEEQGAE